MGKNNDDTKTIPNRINKKPGNSQTEPDASDNRIKKTGDSDTLVVVDNPDDTRYEGKF